MIKIALNYVAVNKLS